MGLDLYFKRDDLLGRWLGGNKLRKLQYIVADAEAAGADTLLTTGSFQSNHAALTAAVASAMGMRAALVLMGPPSRPAPTLNERIARRFGAAVREVTFDDEASRKTLSSRVDEAAAQLRGELEAQGARIFTVPGGGCCPAGSFAFVQAFGELHEQMRGRGIDRYRIVLAVGTGSTYAGLLCGARQAGANVKVLGISIARRNPRCAAETLKAANALCAELNAPPPGLDDLDIRDDFVGEGYAIPTAGSARGVEAALKLEAVPMCHTYAGKALGALMELPRSEFGHDPVVFWHTGGVAGAVDDLLEK